MISSEIAEELTTTLNIATESLSKLESLSGRIELSEEELYCLFDMRSKISMAVTDILGLVEEGEHEKEVELLHTYIREARDTILSIDDV